MSANEADAGEPDTPEDAAGEYVLGTLDPAEAQALRERLAHDKALNARVYAWQDRLLPLTARAPAQEPSPTLWRRIEALVDAVTQGTPQRPSPAQDRGWWQRIGWWQSLSAAAVAASIVLATLLFQRVFAPDDRFLALLQAPGGGATAWVVEVEARGQLKLVPVAASPAPPPGKALQFWTKPKGAAGPTSLGLVQAGRPAEMPAARLPAVEAEQLFEITLEPEGGSTIERPTGPVLYIGKTVRI